MRKILAAFNSRPTLVTAAALVAYADAHPKKALALRDSDRLSLAAARGLR